MSDNPLYSVILYDESFDHEYGTRHQWGYEVTRLPDDMDEETAKAHAGDILCDMVCFDRGHLKWEDDPRVEVEDVR